MLAMGQTLSIASYEAPGTGTLPYTYNFIVFNTVSNTIVANQLGAAAASQYYKCAIISNSPLMANVIVTDSASSPTSKNSINTFNIIVIVGVSMTANALLDSGQNETLQATATGLVSPYTVNFYNATGSGTNFRYTGSSNGSAPTRTH